MQPTIIRSGTNWTAVQSDSTSHYDPFISKLKSLPLKKRLSEESNYMNELQSDEKKWARYFIISSGWV